MIFEEVCMYLSSYGGSCVLNFNVCFIFSNWHLIFLSRICIIAGNISPIDVITHVPVLCEEANIPYVYVPSKEVSLIFFSPLWLLVMLLSSLMHSLMVVYFHVFLAKRCSVGEFMNIFCFYLRFLFILSNGEIERVKILCFFHHDSVQVNVCFSSKPLSYHHRVDHKTQSILDAKGGAPLVGY